MSSEVNTDGAAGAASGPLWALSRRSFIAALAIGGCTRLARPSRQPAPSETTWALLSDTHVSWNQDWTVRGDNMADNLRSAVDAVLLTKPDRVLFNGDMAFARGEVRDYAAFHQIIAPLRNTAKGPLHFTLGNHDHRERFLATLAERGCEKGFTHRPLLATQALATQPAAPPGAVDCKATCRFMDGGIEWFLLDSLETVNAVRGNLGSAQLNWLTARLEADRRTPAIVCVHHNPHALTGLADARAFLDVILTRRRVKLVLYGHTHQFRVWEREGLHFVNLPAVGYRFHPDAALGWIAATVSSSRAVLDFIPLGNAAPAPAITRLAWRTDG